MTTSLDLLQEDFKLFLQALWAQLDLPSPTRAQYAIADYLQHGPKRLQIQAFRGVGKSWITGAFVLWTLFKDPEKKIMIISASKERADNMSIFLQKLISSSTMFFASSRAFLRISLSFTPDNFFITGDLAKRDENGYLTLVGRESDMIISGGLNVYPKEVENHIDEIHEVRESAVIGVPHPDLGEGVVAVVDLKEKLIDQKKIENKNLKLNLKDSTSPVLIEDPSDKNSFYVIMPMKI